MKFFGRSVEFISPANLFTSVIPWCKTKILCPSCLLASDSNFENFSRIVSISLFFLYLLTLNLLYRFISYGKQLYLFLVVAGIVLNYFSGSVIYTAFSGMLDQIGGLISGAILILLYFSPVKDNFDKK